MEVRKDAQLAREVEFAIPRELDQAEGIRLAREFVQAEFVDKGMIADLNVHWDIDADGTPKPHAHVMLTTPGRRPGRVWAESPRLERNGAAGALARTLGRARQHPAGRTRYRCACRSP